MMPLKELLIFALPIIFGQIGQMLIHAGDVYIAAKHSRETLAAISLAGGLMSPLFVMGLAMHFGLSPLLARRIGEGQNINHRASPIIFYALINGPIFMALTLPLYLLVPHLGYEPKLVPLIQEYLLLILLSYPFAFLYQGLREFFQAKDKVIFANILSIICVLLNVAFNWVLVFNFDLGVKGLAYASLGTRIIMAAGMLYIAKPYLKHKFLDIPFLKDTLKLSWPIALSVLVEVTTFALTTVVIGKFGQIESAAQSVVLTIASIVFMVPMAISSATSTKVGHAHGQHNTHYVKAYAKSGLILSLAFMGTSAILIGFFPQFFFRLFSQDMEVYASAKGLLIISALFQLGDGAQVTLSGILRGLGKTRVVFLSFLLCFWFFGLPLGVFLSTALNYKAQGMWIGLASGVYLVAFVLAFQLKKFFRA